MVGVGVTVGVDEGVSVTGAPSQEACFGVPLIGLFICIFAISMNAIVCHPGRVAIDSIRQTFH